jgi:uncharacterized protein (UPF0261 family)
MTGKHIAVLCTLDTKSEHAACVKALIEGRGHRAIMIDIGVLADKTRAELAHAAGADISALAGLAAQRWRSCQPERNRLSRSCIAVGSWMESWVLAGRSAGAKASVSGRQFPCRRKV